MVYRTNAKVGDRTPCFLVIAWRSFLDEWLPCSALVSALLGAVVFIASLAMVRSPREFREQYEQPLQLAIVATDPEVTLLNLQRAIGYAEANGLTRGNTTRPPRPQGDLLAWHRTLIAAAADVATLTPATPIQESRRVLARVRRQLASSAYEPRLPEDIDTYPKHGRQKVMIRISLALFALAAILAVAIFRRASHASQS